MIFLLQRDIINPVNYDFKRICDKNKYGTLLIYPINCVAGKSGMLSHHLFAHLSTIVIGT